MLMSQVQSRNSNSSSCAHAVSYCVYPRRCVPSNVLFLYVSLHGAAHTQPWTENPRAELACSTVEFLSFGGVLIQLALFSSGTGYVWISPPFSWKQCSVDLDRSVCSTQLFCDGGMSGLTFPFWLVFRGRALLAGISNHRYRGWRERLSSLVASPTLPFLWLHACCKRPQWKQLPGSRFTVMTCMFIYIEMRYTDIVTYTQYSHSSVNNSDSNKIIIFTFCLCLFSCVNSLICLLLKS